MTDIVTIKDIGKESIWMEEIETESFGMKTAIFISVIIICITITWGLLIHSFDITYIITIGWMTALCLCVLFLIFSRLIFNYTPAYRIFIPMRGIEIIVPKINEMLDQQEICKAVNTLVPIAQEFNNRREKNERIAKNCK